MTTAIFRGADLGALAARLPWRRVGAKHVGPAACLLFAVGLIVKIFSLPFFGSRYSHTLFLPFLSAAAEAPLKNPWAHFAPHYFPYGTVLYGIMVLPQCLGHMLVSDGMAQHPTLALSLLKAPLFVADLVLFLTLCRLAPQQVTAFVWGYWLNPIAFYITYVHTQLDVVCMALCMLALKVMIAGSIVASALLFAAAALCKTHVFIAVPFIVAFLYKRRFYPGSLIDCGFWLMTFCSVTALGLLPQALQRVVTYALPLNEQARLVFGPRLNMGEGQFLLLGFGALLAVLGRLCAATRISAMGLVYGVGILFGALSVVTPSMPGWYLWSLPFIALFYAQFHAAPKALLLAYGCAYLGHFAVVKPYLANSFELIASASFTVLQTILCALLWCMGFMCVRREAPVTGVARPLTIGIAGDSASGKDSLSEVLRDLFVSDGVAVLQGDDYHRWPRGNAKWADYTHLDPRANYLQALSDHAQDLIEGLAVFHPRYDHASGNFTAPKRIGGSRLLIVQGLHALYLNALRSQMMLKIFLRPDPLVRLAWKLHRDVHERGHAKKGVLAAIIARQGDGQKHIEPQSEVADWVIETSADSSFSYDDAVAGHLPTLKVRHLLPNDPNVMQLYDGLRLHSNLGVDLELAPQVIDRIVLTVKGDIAAHEVDRVAKHIFVNLRAATQTARPPQWHGGMDGVAQLIALSLMTHKVDHASRHCTPQKFNSIA